MTENLRLKAYLTYQTAAAKLDTIHFDNSADFRAANDLMSLIMGNMAVVCTGVSHGNVIQVGILHSLVVP